MTRHVTVFIAVFLSILCTDSNALPLSSNQVSVVDGDTIRIIGGDRTIRLVNFNAPETRRALCPAERELGHKAAQRLRQLVARNRLDLEIIKCSCQPGSEGTQACNYGRSCGVLLINGTPAGDILIQEGLAVPFVCEKQSCPTTPRPWCN